MFCSRKKILIKSLLSEEKVILAAHNWNFYSLHKTDKKKAFTVLFEKLDILKKNLHKKILEKFILFFYKKGHPGLNEYSPPLAAHEGRPSVINKGRQEVVDEGKQEVVNEGRKPVIDKGREAVVANNNTVASYLKVS